MNGRAVFRVSSSELDISSSMDKTFNEQHLGASLNHHQQGKILNKLSSHYHKKFKYIESKHRSQLNQEVFKNDLLHASLCTQRDCVRDVNYENNLLRDRLEVTEKKLQSLTKQNQVLQHEKDGISKICERWYERSKTLSRLILTFNTILNHKDGMQTVKKMEELLDEHKVTLNSIPLKELPQQNTDSISILHYQMLHQMLVEEQNYYLVPFKKIQKSLDENISNEYKERVQQLESHISLLENQLISSKSKEQTFQQIIQRQERLINDLKAHIEKSEQLRMEREETILKLEHDNQMLSLQSKHPKNQK